MKCSNVRPDTFFCGHLFPEKPASGKLLLRMPPEIHAAALVKAKAAGKSLNQWATEILGKATHA